MELIGHVYGKGKKKSAGAGVLLLIKMDDLQNNSP